MKKYLMTALAVTFLSPVVIHAPAMADDDKLTRAERHEKWKGMSAEERKEAVQQRRESWRNMTDEEKEAKKADMKAKYDSLSDEQKAKLDARRDRVQERRATIRDNRGQYNN